MSYFGIKMIIVLCGIFLLSKNLCAQNTNYGWLKHWELGVEKNVFLSADIYSYYWEHSDEIGLTLSAGNEFVFGKQFLTAPKISATYNLSGFMLLRTDFSMYNDFKNFQPVITPKVGIGIFGAMFFYGRNINLNNNTRFTSLGKNQFGITFNLIPNISLPIGY